MKIYFVTENTGKIASMQANFARFGLEVEQVRLRLVEPQEDSVEEVALSKAKQAHEVLKVPMIVEDYGFYINALGGFPGPYTKYILGTIGAEGMLRLLEGVGDRTCGFIGALVYVDERGIPRMFVDKGKQGSFAEKIDNTPCEEAWSDLWSVFIPSGRTRPLSALTVAERGETFADWQNSWASTQFAQWMFAKTTSAQGDD